MTPRINWTPSPKEIRQFGLVVWIGFGLIGALSYWKGHAAMAQAFWGCTTAVALLSWVVPAAAKPFYLVWMGVGFVLGSIMSRIVLALIYFGMITPMALFFRLTGRDELRLKRRFVKSYWTDHPDIPKSNYSRLF